MIPTIFNELTSCFVSWLPFCLFSPESVELTALASVLQSQFSKGGSVFLSTPSFSFMSTSTVSFKNTNWLIHLSYEQKRIQNNYVTTRMYVYPVTARIKQLSIILYGKGI